MYEYIWILFIYWFWRLRENYEKMRRSIHASSVHSSDNTHRCNSRLYNFSKIADTYIFDTARKFPLSKVNDQGSLIFKET